MRQEVIVRFAGGPELTLGAPAPLPMQAAREWLDREYVRLECEPVRASGKVLTADKLLSVAQAVGEAGFADAAWAGGYAAAALGALDKPLVRVDLETLSVGY